MQQLIADLLKRCEMCETHRDLYGETKCMAYVSVDLCGVSFEVAGWSASIDIDVYECKCRTWPQMSK